MTGGRVEMTVGKGRLQRFPYDIWTSSNLGSLSLQNETLPDLLVVDFPLNSPEIVCV